MTLPYIPDDEALYAEPTFRCEPPDGQRNLTELMRAVQFRKLMRALAPRVLLYANANAGKRNPRQASREGIMAGCFDYTAVWDGGCAWIELKGYTARGQAGKLSQAQVDFGNRLEALGHDCAAFFRPESAVEWLRQIGAPVSGRVSA